MITYIQGDLLKAFQEGKVNAIAHGCNCIGIMGAGIAKAIADKWPKVSKYDKNMRVQKEKRLGKVTVVSVDEGIVFNCYTQLNFGSGVQVDYDAIRSCMKRLNKHLEIRKDMKLGLPKIGAGLGGGDWEIIEKIIEEEIQKEIFVYYLED